MFGDANGVRFRFQGELNPGTRWQSSAPICASNQWLFPPPRAPPLPIAFGPPVLSHSRAAPGRQPPRLQDHAGPDEVLGPEAVGVGGGKQVKR